MTKAVQIDLITKKPFAGVPDTRRKCEPKEGLEFLRDAIKCGGYVPVGVAAGLSGVTRSAIHQHIASGRLKARFWKDIYFIEGDSLSDYIESKKKQK